MKLKTLELYYILKTLKHFKGNRTKTAKALGISIRSLRNKINDAIKLNSQIILPENFSMDRYIAHKKNMSQLFYGNDKWKKLK